jgi:hypothetical protein
MMADDLTPSDLGDEVTPLKRRVRRRRLAVINPDLLAFLQKGAS